MMRKGVLICNYARGEVINKQVRHVKPCAGFHRRVACQVALAKAALKGFTTIATSGWLT